MNLLYFLWNEKGMLPHEYYELGYGEKLILQAFAEYKSEQDNKENKDKVGDLNV